MKLILALVLVAALLLGGDAALRSYVESRAERSIGDQLRAEADVSLGGWPFVVKLLGGRVPEAEVTLTDARRAGLDIDRIHLDVGGVRLKLDGVDAGATIESGRGRAQIELDVFSGFLRDKSSLAIVSVTEDGITVRIPAVGRKVTVPLTLDAGALVIALPTGRRIRVPLPTVIAGVDYRSIEVSGRSAELTFLLDDVALEGS